MVNQKSGTHLSRGKFKKRRSPKSFALMKTSGKENIGNSSRVINLQNLGDAIKLISIHATTCQKCSSKSLALGEAITLVGEKQRNGLASVLTARCNGCGEEITIPTSSKITCLNGSKRWESNLAAVWGQMSTGGGFSSLRETMSSLGVPVMTKKAFIRTEHLLGSVWWEQLEQSMRLVGEEEKSLAISRNDFHENFPAITVIVDGGWSKRTHRHSYNANSGVAVIIGMETKKILFMGVRNKYCSTCARATNREEEIPKHNCFKNWNGSSSSMETDIIVEGFQKAESQHGVRYLRFIGDGDSSVYPDLIAKVPGWGYAIRKMECANHATKCYRSALEKLVQDNTSYKGKGKLTEVMRKRLTKAARCAISMRSREPDKKLAVKLLQKDLQNGPRHCFGFHTKCSTDFCKTAQQRSPPSVSDSVESAAPALSHSIAHTDDIAQSSDTTVSPSDIEDILQEQEQAWRDATDDSDLEAVQSIDEINSSVDERMMCDINRLVGRLDLLLGNFTTNLCECWMHIRTKFDGGKQINRIQSGSWQHRCAGAGLRQNLGPAWGPKVWKDITNTEPNDTFTAVSEILSKEAKDSKEKKATPHAKKTRKLRKGSSSDNTLQSRRSYSRYDGGQNADDINTDLPTSFLQENMLQYYNANVKVSEQRAKDIEIMTRQQGTDETSANIWLAERRKRITASNVGAIVKRKKTTKVGNKVKQLLYSTFKGSAATRWGTLQEPESQSRYIQLKAPVSPDISVTTSGLVICSSHPWLGASPDGLVQDPQHSSSEGIVEFKNPYTARNMTIQDAIKNLKDFCLKQDQDGLITLRTSHNYYYQVQTTMMCAKRKWCDFVVCTNQDMHVERIPYNEELLINKLLPSLQSFYFSAVLPELTCPRHQKGGIREPEDWLDNSTEWQDKFSH